MNDSVVDTGHCVSNNKAMESSITSSKSDSEASAPVIKGSSNELPSTSLYLSNRERLLLRKQALKIKKRPVLAIGILFTCIFFLAILYVLCFAFSYISLVFFFSGKSNIMTGVAKAINTHFQKHPFAIVNVKGRAKGTSVQEVVSELEVAHAEISPLFSHLFLVELFFLVLSNKYSLNPEICFPYYSCSKQQVPF